MPPVKTLTCGKLVELPFNLTSNAWASLEFTLCCTYLLCFCTSWPSCTAHCSQKQQDQAAVRESRTGAVVSLSRALLLCAHLTRNHFQFVLHTDDKVASEFCVLCLRLWSHEDDLSILAGVHFFLFINWRVYGLLSIGTAVFICLLALPFLWQRKQPLPNKKNPKMFVI